MTDLCERKHGSIPAEPWAFMWTTTLLQVWGWAKWRKMMSSQAGRTLSPSSCSAVWSTARVTLSTHLQQSYSTSKPNSQKYQGRGRWIIGSIWSGGLFSPLCSVLKTFNLQSWEKNGLKCPMEEPSHKPNAVFTNPGVLQLHYTQLSL